MLPSHFVYHEQIQAEDDGTVDAVRSSTHVLTVTVIDGNNDSPLFNPSYYVFSVSETETNGHTVDSVSATDGEGVTYTLTGGNTGNTFRIESVSGEIIVNDDTALDYDAVGATLLYQLEVTGNKYTSSSEYKHMNVQNCLLIIRCILIIGHIQTGYLFQLWSLWTILG